MTKRLLLAARLLALCPQPPHFRASKGLRAELSSSRPETRTVVGRTPETKVLTPMAPGSARFAVPGFVTSIAPLISERKLSAQLKARLSYAMMKVQNGWESKSIDEIEKLQTSPRVPSFCSPNRARPSSDAGISSTPLRSPGLAGRLSGTAAERAGQAAQIIRDRVNLAPPCSAGFDYARSSTAPALAPAADIRPSVHRRSDSRNRQQQAPKGSAPSTPKFVLSLLRSPSSTSAAEQDAVDTLLFLSSPNNTQHSHHHSVASSADPSPLRSAFPRSVPAFPQSPRVGLINQRIPSDNPQAKPEHSTVGRIP